MYSKDHWLEWSRYEIHETFSFLLRSFLCPSPPAPVRPLPPTPPPLPCAAAASYGSNCHQRTGQGQGEGPTAGSARRRQILWWRCDGRHWQRGTSAPLPTRGGAAFTHSGGAAWQTSRAPRGRLPAHGGHTTRLAESAALATGYGSCWTNLTGTPASAGPRAASTGHEFSRPRESPRPSSGLSLVAGHCRLGPRPTRARPAMPGSVSPLPAA